MASRRQHVVPCFYLKDFFPGYVYRKSEKSPRYTKKVRNICVRKDYYGKSRDEILLPLDEINSVIEAEAAPAIQKMLFDLRTVNQVDWIKLSYFFANMQIRNPYYIESLQDTFRKFTDQLNEMAEKIKESYEKAKAEGEEFAMPTEPNVYDSERYSLEEINKSMEELETKDGHIRIAEDLYYHLKDIASYVQKMSLHIMEATGATFFITTDTPLVLFSLTTGTPLGAGWANSDAMAMIPISPRYSFMLAYRGKPSIYTKTLTTYDVNLWNVNLMRYASQEVYSKYAYDLAQDWMLRRGLWDKKQ